MEWLGLITITVLAVLIKWAAAESEASCAAQNATWKQSRVDLRSALRC